MPYWVLLTSNALFLYFWARILKKTNVIFEISTLKFVYLQNFTKKQKCLNFGPKMADLGILGLELENNIVVFEISTLKFLTKESLTRTVDFGRGSAFSEGPLYKVCPFIAPYLFQCYASNSNLFSYADDSCLLFQHKGAEGIEKMLNSDF